MIDDRLSCPQLLEDLSELIILDISLLSAVKEIGYVNNFI